MIDKPEAPEVAEGTDFHLEALELAREAGSFSFKVFEYRGKN
ncbi:hypothetical protein [Mycobacterium sp. OTB74]|jgi:hypothetical protein|nr:hypothetical protein [Mycobacterium sp. OTB74]MDH6246868.1 hypothetical protein [Mycobacterium sp. OTB74]